MVNVHLNFEKTNFKSKNSIEKFKKKLKESINNGLSIDIIDIHFNTKDYLNSDIVETKVFSFNKVDDDIFVKLIDNKKDNNPFEVQIDDGKTLLKQKLKKLSEERTGLKYKDLNDVKKNNDKEMYKKYEVLKNIYDAPIEKPHVLIKECEKFRDLIEIFSSGFMQFTEDDRINDMVRDYHRIISDRLGWKLLTMNEFIVKYYKESNSSNQLNSINMTNDSDTESDKD
jgi:hypothetical protein